MTTEYSSHRSIARPSRNEEIMTLCELLTVIKHEKGGAYELFINRSWDLPTFNYSTLCNTVDEWIDGFTQGDVWWSDRDNDDEDGDFEERHVWEMEVLFAEAELIQEEGPYEEPAGHWVCVDI